MLFKKKKELELFLCNRVSEATIMVVWTQAPTKSVLVMMIEDTNIVKSVQI